MYVYACDGVFNGLAAQLAYLSFYSVLYIALLVAENSRSISGALAKPWNGEPECCHYQFIIASELITDGKNSTSDSYVLHCAIGRWSFL